LVRREEFAKKVVYGPDATPYISTVQTYARAGYDRVWFHQIGTEQASFLQFAEEQLLPGLRDVGSLGEQRRVSATSG
jgi:hypothetical protein